MKQRLKLQSILEELLGSRRVYFQPPTSIQLVYPCIVYSLSSNSVTHADDRLYSQKKQYTVTVIDKNPDSLLPDKVQELPFSSFSTRFTKDRLYHTVYSVYI